MSGNRTGAVTFGDGTRDDPWLLKTPCLSSDYRAWRDAALDPPALVVAVGTTILSYRLHCIDDLAAMLRAHDPGNPVGGYCGLRKGYRGRFANYVCPVLELLGRAEPEHGARNTRIRAIPARP